MSSGSRPPILPNPPRWEPTKDPADIVVPGLDTTASVNDQIDQIEQLITIKLQNIDSNFSKIQHLMSTKVLPAVKRYAVSTEPVREAAKFWTSFYEQAAQVRIPTYEGYPSHEQQSQSEYEEETETSSQADATVTPTPTHTFDPDTTAMPSESSFMPGQGAISSTPATASRHRVMHPHDSFASQNDQPSWAASLESPLVRLDREMQDFTKDDSYLPPSAKKPSQWLGLAADAGGLSVASSPIQKRQGKSHQKQYSSSTIDVPSLTSIAAPSQYHFNDSFDDSVDLVPGMSPPVTMQYARAPRSSIGLGLLPKLGRTPGKEAAERIRRDLLGDTSIQMSSRYNLHTAGQSSGAGVLSGRYGTDSTMSTLPTPPSLSRYMRSTSHYDSNDDDDVDATLESMLRRVGLNPPSSTADSLSTGRSLSTNHDIKQATFAPPPEPEPATPEPQPYLQVEDDVAVADQHEDLDSDSDSLDEQHNPGQPSTAFLMASQHESDDSFGSSNHSSDSFNEEHDGGSAPVHPFARAADEVEGEVFDDSFEDEAFDTGPQEETVFGIPPAQRQHASNSAGRLRLLGEDLLQDTIGIGTQLARAGRVEESPTPFGAMR